MQDKIDYEKEKEEKESLANLYHNDYETFIKAINQDEKKPIYFDKRYGPIHGYDPQL